MGQLDLISRARADKGRSHRLRAFLASCIFHGLALCLILGLALLYGSHTLPPKSGSAPGSPSISLEKMVLVSPPSQPPPPQLPKPTPELPVPAPTVADIAPPRETPTKPTPPEAAVPVLAMRPSKPAQPTPAKARTAIHPAISHTATTTAQSLSKPAAAASVSSYAPGVNVMPHPPYPQQAWDLQQTGTVTMNVHFDVKGDVAQVEVAQSSGVAVLDSETKSFIRGHWHCPALAGQIKSVPVLYQLK